MNDFYFILFGVFLALSSKVIEQILLRRLSKRESLVFSQINNKGGRSLWR